MSKGKGSENIEKEDIFRAVLVADDFDEVFSPFLRGGCSAFLPLASRNILDYALELLSRSGIQETVLFCSARADAIKEYVKNCPWSQNGSNMKIVLMVSEKCMSLGDALRDIDNKAIIKSDFVLLSTFTVANLPLQEILKDHKAQCKKDRGAAMTLIFQDRGCERKGKETILAVNSVTNRLLLYSKEGAESKVPIPMEFFAEHPQLTIYSTLKDTGVALCSPSVPLLFSDNFDFQTKEDFIRGLLMNEEVLASRIYCHVTNGYGFTVQDWPSYQRVTMDVLHRWTYPLVPDAQFGSTDPLIHYRGCIYKHPLVNLSKGCKLFTDVAIGKGSTLGSNANVVRSVIGAGCKVGDNVTIEDSFIMDGVTVLAIPQGVNYRDPREVKHSYLRLRENRNNFMFEPFENSPFPLEMEFSDESAYLSATPCLSGARIELSVVGHDVKVGFNVSLRNCQLHRNVILGDETSIQDKIITSEREDDSCEEIGKSAFIKSTAGGDTGSDIVETTTYTWLEDPNVPSDDDGDISSASDSNESGSELSEADDCAMFYSEVVDSLQRGYEEHLPCSNLILEVNSSRYAYNVTLSEVTQLMCKAVFALPSRLKCPAKPLLTYFKPLFANYVKTKDGQLECLSAFEEMHNGLGNELNNCLHYLYDEDVLDEDTIIKWHKNLHDTSLESKLNKFITWLKEAAEESDDSDEE